MLLLYKKKALQDTLIHCQKIENVSGLKREISVFPRHLLLAVLTGIKTLAYKTSLVSVLYRNAT